MRSSAIEPSTGNPGLQRLLRIEGACELLLALTLYAHLGASWVTFALCFLAPDLAFIAYWFGPRALAIAYNSTHAVVGPVLTALVGLTLLPAALPFALIWFAHIGFDRMLGYGLKSVTSHRITHLGLVGRER
jgi:hypothetical protein